MALTKALISRDGRESPQAYAVIYGMRLIPVRKKATFGVRIYHTEAIRRADSERFIDDPIEVDFNDDYRAGVDQSFWERARELPDAELAAVLGIDVEGKDWEAVLATWKTAHPYYSELFTEAALRRGGHAPVFYAWAKEHHPIFSQEWSDA